MASPDQGQYWLARRVVPRPVFPGLRFDAKLVLSDGYFKDLSRDSGDKTMTLMHYIGGAETAGTSGRQQDVFNPATGAAITCLLYTS